MPHTKSIVLGPPVSALPSGCPLTRLEVAEGRLRIYKPDGTEFDPGSAYPAGDSYVFDGPRGASCVLVGVGRVSVTYAY